MSTPVPFTDYSDPPAAVQRYRAFARIGRGGMAEVFLAVTPGAAATKLVVLKRMWPELATDPAFVEMFLDEARLSARMSHPNVVQTFDVIDQAGRLTMAMEYLDGQPLTRVLNRLSTSGAMSDLTLAQRLRIVIDILSGLDHVHELTDYKGHPLCVVHRDVSPHNVFITYDGHVKLMDFGVAKTMAGAHLSGPGTIKGKLAYMAPDQLRTAPIDRRADIFSVGVILWEMLSGRRLWPGKTEVSIVRHLSYRLPLPTLPEGLNLPMGLAEVCQRAMALDPADRYRTAAEMEIQLQRLLPVVADSYARNLGKIVSIAFSAERAERQALIDRHLLSMGAGDDFDVSVRVRLDDDVSADEVSDAGGDAESEEEYDGGHNRGASDARAEDGDDDDDFNTRSDTAFEQPAMLIRRGDAFPDMGEPSPASPLWRWGAAGVAVVAVPTIIVLLVALASKRTGRESLPPSQARPSVATIVIDPKPPDVEPLRALARAPEAPEPRPPLDGVAEPPQARPVDQRKDESGDDSGTETNMAQGSQKKRLTTKKQQVGLFSEEVGDQPRAARRSRHRRGIDTVSPFLP